MQVTGRSENGHGEVKKGGVRRGLEVPSSGSRGPEARWMARRSGAGGLEARRLARAAGASRQGLSVQWASLSLSQSRP